MKEPKMKVTDIPVEDFLNQIENPKKREDAFKLIEIFAETTGYQAKMWGPSIIGFGSYHYRYKSGHEGDAPLAGFSPRAAKISLYFSPGDSIVDEILMRLGKHTRGVSCAYIKKIEDININVLKELILQSIRVVYERYPFNQDNQT
jgi:hypothetical protein